MRDFLRRKGMYGLMLALSIFSLIGSVKLSAANYPSIPVLTLTGDVNGAFNKQMWYPDGRIWLPLSEPNAGVQGRREFLLPVFIDNRWFQYEDSKLKADPIKSFQFTILYDSTALEAVGVQTFGPKHKDPNDPTFNASQDLDYIPLASEFTIKWSDRPDFSYQKVIKPYLAMNPPETDNRFGRGLTISGTSDKALPNTNLQNPEMKVLLYVKFRVVPNNGASLGTAAKTPIIISNDTIRYNNMNIAKEAPFRGQDKYFPTDVVSQNSTLFFDPVDGNGNVSNWDTDNPRWPGLAGIYSKIITQADPLTPHVPGLIWAFVMSDYPLLHFSVDGAESSRLFQFYEEGKDDTQEPLPGKEVYVLSDPITVDEIKFSVPPYPEFGNREIELKNVISRTRLTDITVESDEEWLEFKTTDKADAHKNLIKSYTRKGYINWIDQDILGTEKDIIGANTAEDGKVYLDVRCNPTKLKSTDKPGIYVGYITFKSASNKINPVRVKVTFIYFKAPAEGNRPNDIGGINLTLTNANNEKSTIVFGTGDRATLGVDTLFGEHAYKSDFNSSVFQARFFPRDEKGNEVTQYGLGDFASNFKSVNRKSDSRDIRSTSDILQSLIYPVKFFTKSKQDYPIVIQWNVNDFPAGSQLYLRDASNGTDFNVDMRNATNLGDGNFSYTIQDPKFSGFIIEYTVPKVISYVDEYGDAIIKQGWNLLSLPVKPLDNAYNAVYKNALNVPIRWYQAGYQDKPNLIEGEGYFVKYSNIRDKQFAGTFISEISVNRGSAVRVLPGDKDKGGWNLIGALSSPNSIDVIDFDNYSTYPKPDRAYTKKNGIWGYTTDEGYKEVSMLLPGRGYWIKVDQHGYLKMKNANKLGSSNELSTKMDIYNNSTLVEIKDNSAKNGKVYLSSNPTLDLNVFEMPPVPASEIFDVRFATNRKLENAEVSYISLQGVTYPASLNVNDAKANYTFIDPLTNTELGNVTFGNSSNIAINNEDVKVIKVVKTEVETSQVSFNSFPNPTTDVINFEFALANNDNVTVQIFDQLGNVVKTIADNEMMNKGTRTINANVKDLVAGSYLCKITNSNTTNTVKFTVVK